MPRFARALPILWVLACGPAEPGAGSTGTTEQATLGGSTTGTPTTGVTPTATDATTAVDTSTTAATTTNLTTDAPTTTNPTTDATTTTTGVETTTGVDATTAGSSTGAPLDVCDRRPLPDMAQHACDAFTTGQDCADNGCFWLEVDTRWTEQDCVCLEERPTAVCVFTGGPGWLGSQTPSAMFRAVAGAVEVIAIDHLVSPPPGWSNCGDFGSPALCECPCPEVFHCI